jgi:hypothetical protein
MRVNLTIGIPCWLDRICAWPVVVYRKWKFGYSYQRIYLDEGLWTIVDPKDYYRFACFKWVIGRGKGKFYAIRGQVISPADSKIVQLHRLIMDAPDGLLVDHRNGVSLDNRSANLRLATQSQNQCNKRKRENTTSRYRGVYFNKEHRKWAAFINVNGKKIWLGYFDCETEAARVYDEAAKKYRGGFTRLNFPEEAPVS